MWLDNGMHGNAFRTGLIASRMQGKSPSETAVRYGMFHAKALASSPCFIVIGTRVPEASHGCLPTYLGTLGSFSTIANAYIVARGFIVLCRYGHAVSGTTVHRLSRE